MQTYQHYRCRIAALEEAVFGQNHPVPAIAPPVSVSVSKTANSDGGVILQAGPDWPTLLQPVSPPQLNTEIPVMSEQADVAPPVPISCVSPPVPPKTVFKVKATSEEAVSLRPSSLEGAIQEQQQSLWTAALKYKSSFISKI
eukprot:Gregarina_sp_Poly_1__198@NODE_1046_length_5256_cov_159_119676_g726_i0_p4_GENE_NODE_1046_length_5256_cov_159_119676_g726_i0NODE_1046_length_5256_cov_159_119676_g726_i0_p4_ORF_typecomplete_len142_score27_71_NODE_1046_length_5256_cov_159_119676_g726_i027213146